MTCYIIDREVSVKAINSNDIELLKSHIKNGAFVNWVLDDACICGNLHVVQSLIKEYKITNLNDVLSTACFYKRFDIAKYLIEKGASYKSLREYETATLLNIGLDIKLLRGKAKWNVKIRNKRNKSIREILLKCTTISDDVISVLCDYTEYPESL